MQGKFTFELNRDRGMKIVIDLGRLPDDPGKRANVDFYLRTLAEYGVIEVLEWDRNANG